MKVCILGNGLISLTLAKTLVNQGIYVDIFHRIIILSIKKPKHWVFQNQMLIFLTKIFLI